MGIALSFLRESDVIRSFYINNFKSLIDFSLSKSSDPMGHFTCLIGLNGSGKSTVLQAFDFMGHLASENGVQEFLKAREWKKTDCKSQYSNKRIIDFEIGFYFQDLGLVSWSGGYNIDLQYCTSESIKLSSPDQNISTQTLLDLKKGTVLIQTRSTENANLDLSLIKYQGSCLSALKMKKEYHPAILAVKQLAESLKSLDMLTPQAIRKRAKKSEDIGYGGELLSGYLATLKSEPKSQIIHALKDFYPQVQNWETRALRAGWQELHIHEKWNGTPNPFETYARHINDGMLRILAILAQLQPQTDGNCQHPFLLFDEIENGINPELTEKLVDLLLKAQPQIMVTTHSPMLLNWLSDEQAQESVYLLYRNQAGHTQATRFFDLPQPQKYLEMLGPGEVFVHVDLQKMAEEAMKT